MPTTRTHTRKQGGKPKRRTKTPKETSYIVNVTLRGDLGRLIKSIVEESGAPASRVCATMIARGISSDPRAAALKTPEQLIMELAQAHELVQDGRVKPRKPLTVAGEGLGDAIERAKEYFS